MQTAIKFYTESQASEALAAAKATQKPLLIDYWAHNCKGCARMDSLTYEDEQVQEYLSENYIVLKCNVAAVDGAFAKTFLTTAVIWTPSLYIYSPEGVILRTVVGYVSPAQFLTELGIGRAAHQMRRRHFAEAGELLEQLPFAAQYPALHAEAIYWAGIAAFFQHQNSFDHLVGYWADLRKKYPETTWAEKADFIPE
ncbi:thioredoxin family protein [Pseudoflavitalea sp. G-6-1-2]|uniref:thioredoxin family protein n=1 Tax=Pseudoflavitalea sp. G-6-1-2 TaxID=2728841 RepID=UPI00146AEE3C|nr:thioredoxin family protein [Pseudoflavitalea sp. G-6-1-2]NML21430.1 thioredoxin family protein [Pseudoflavitalea sp. G-6-1-2]